ncbi:hypothetical protein PTKIN_Ptkin17bG0087200 [Pterospermum kingtungense]
MASNSQMGSEDPIDFEPISSLPAIEEVSLTVDDEDNIMTVEVKVKGKETEKLTRGKRKRDKKFTSAVWAAFNVLPEKTLDGSKKVKCKWCGEVKNYFGQYGTGNLKRHMNSYVRRDTRDVGQMILGKQKESLIMRPAKFDSKKFCEKLVAAVVMHNLPSSFVEYSGIKELFAYLCDDAISISRNTTRSDILKLHKKEKIKLKLLLNEASGRICLTSDLWTSVATDGYICLNAHLVDKDWNLQKRVLSFSFMPPPHNGVSLSEKVYSLMAFTHLVVSDSNYKGYPSKDEWAKIEKLSKFLEFVDWAYKKLYEDNSKEFEKVKNTLYSLYDEYTSKPSYSTSSTSTINKVNKSAQYESTSMVDLHSKVAWKEFDSFDLEYGVATKKSQLELYFEEPKVDRSMDLNVLHFWKQSAFRYPELATMARDILSIPITIVASESTFSLGDLCKEDSTSTSMKCSSTAPASARVQDTDEC